MPPQGNTSKIFGVAREFHCEHLTSKSRVYAVVHTATYYPSVEAVLTCTDRIVAQLAAYALAAVADSGRGPHLDAVIERVLERLPDAPATSFIHAVQWAEDSTWPLDPKHLVEWRSFRSEFGFEQDSSLPTTPEFRDHREHTPADVHLADLSGDVVRILSLLEVHVHDRRRLLAAATAEGYPLDPNEGDDAHVLDAIMLLADTRRNPPGTTPLENASDGSYLSAEHGDEIAEWSDIPVTADFGIGWRVSRARRGED